MKNALVNCFLILCAMLSVPALAEESNPVLATVAGDPITKQDLLYYARESAYMLPYLSIPGGPMRILEDMIKERLLILEAGRLGIVQGEKNSSAFAYEIRQYLAPSCPIPDEQLAKSFYTEHPDKFSTPIFLRLYRYGMPFSDENESTVLSQMNSLVDRIRRGETTLSAVVAANKKESDVVRQGDIGFLANDDPDNPVMKVLVNAPANQIVGPLKQKDWFFLYQVTDRREPILASYESVKSEVAVVQREECSRQKFEKLFNELRQHWKVKMLVDNIDIHPEAK